MPTRSSPMLQSYSEFLASSFGNFTQTYFADHSELWSHDQINRQLRSQKWTPRSLRQYLRNQILFSHQGAIYSLTTRCLTSDIRISLKWCDYSGAATPTQ
jgi:hypothetical protein